MKQWFRAVADGLGGRIALMCLLTAAPLMVLLGAGAVIDRTQELRAAKARVLDLARLGAEEHREIIADTANMLRLLADSPAVRAMLPRDCDKAVATAANADHRIDRIEVIRPDGAIACSSRPDLRRPTLGDRGYFRQAMMAAPAAPPASDIIRSRVSGQLTLVAAVPLPAAAPGAPPLGVIAAALSTGWLAELDPRIPSPLHHILLVIDPSDGTVLGRHPGEDAAPSGGRADRRLLAAFARLPDGGIITVAGGKSESVIFGFAPIPVGHRRLLLAVGLARTDVLAGVNDRIWFGGALALATIFAAMLLAWAAARILVLRPVEALATAADRLGGGDLAARAPTCTRVAELRALGTAFNRMAAQLQMRTRDLVATQAELAESEAHHRLLAENVTDMITRFGPDFRRRYVSSACRDLLGYTTEEMVGELPGGIVHPDDWLLLDATLNAPLRAGQETARATYRALRKDGRCIWLESSGRRLPDGSGYVVVTRDVSERKAFEEQLETANRRLEELAGQDPLTGLANRRRFEELLAIEHRRARRLGCPLAIVLIDADRFKAYNDRYGHPAGDTCLQAVARAIDSVLRRPQDMAARLGGEEFIVLLPDTDASGAAHMAHCIREAVRALAIEHVDSDAGIVTVSLGVASTGPEDETDEAALIGAADQALYGAKRSGRDAVQVGPL